MHWQRSTLNFIVKPINSMAQSHTLAALIASELQQPNLEGVFILSDGLTVNGPEIPFTGGLAGDATH